MLKRHAHPDGRRGYNRGSDGAANGNLERLYERQGYHAKPTNMTAAELEATPGPAYLRGVPEKRFVKSYVDDPVHRGGAGIYGDGTYMALSDVSDFAHLQGSSGVEVARVFGGRDAEIIAIKWKQGARIVDFKDLQTFQNTFYKEMAEAGIHDMGELATAMGYDGIIVQETQYNVVLNRGATNVTRDWKPFESYWKKPTWGDGT